MLCFASSGSSLGNILELLGLIVVFILVLIATYYCTRWIGKNANIQTGARNIEVIETFRLSQSKYIQILRIGNSRYIAIAVCKDTVEYLTELSKDDLEIISNNEQHNVMPGFDNILKRIRKNNK